MSGSFHLPSWGIVINAFSRTSFKHGRETDRSVRAWLPMAAA